MNTRHGIEDPSLSVPKTAYEAAGGNIDRTTSGRFVRNLALSLGGGALLTLLGASQAKAEERPSTPIPSIEVQGPVSSLPEDIISIEFIEDLG